MFTNNKDVDREILLRVKSDVYFLNASMVNKYAYSLCDEIFFQNRTKRYYPLSVKFLNKFSSERTEGRTKGMWKHHYLSIMKYRELIKKRFGYSQPSDGDFKKYYNVLLFVEKENMKGADKIAVFVENKMNEYAIPILKKYSLNDKESLQLHLTAVKYNNLEVFRYLLSSLTFTDSRNIFMHQMDTLISTIVLGFALLKGKKGEPEYEEKAKEQIEILELYEQGLRKAGISQDHVAMFEYINACKFGEMQLVGHLIGKYKLLPYPMLSGASAGGYWEMVDCVLESLEKNQPYTHQKRIEALNHSLMDVIEGRSENLPSRIPEKRNYYKVVDLLVKYGANNFNDIIEAAVTNGDKEMVEYLRKFL